MMLLVTGSKGQLGQTLKELYPDALFTDVEELDITDEKAVFDFVKSNQVTEIINCAAYTAVDKAEDDEERAYKVNVLGPLNLAKTGAKLVQISTDYVFGGVKSTPCKEGDEKCPLSVYGKTKAECEDLLLKEAKTVLILRTSWLYSPYGNNFVKTMRRLGKERETLTVIFDQVGSPTFALDLAKAIYKILPKLKEGEKKIFNYSNEGVCSWYDFATEIMRLSGIPCHVLPIESFEYKTKATRPCFSVLNKRAIKEAYHVEVPYWRESLQKCIALLEKKGE